MDNKDLAFELFTRLCKATHRATVYRYEDWVYVYSRVNYGVALPQWAMNPWALLETSEFQHAINETPEGNDYQNDAVDRMIAAAFGEEATAETEEKTQQKTEQSEDLQRYSRVWQRIVTEAGYNDDERFLDENGYYVKAFSLDELAAPEHLAHLLHRVAHVEAMQHFADVMQQVFKKAATERTENEQHKLVRAVSLAIDDAFPRLIYAAQRYSNSPTHQQHLRIVAMDADMENATALSVLFTALKYAEQLFTKHMSELKDVTFQHANNYLYNASNCMILDISDSWLAENLGAISSIQVADFKISYVESLAENAVQEVRGAGFQTKHSPSDKSR